METDVLFTLTTGANKFGSSDHLIPGMQYSGLYTGYKEINIV